jgi:hypothetical protein
MRGLSESTKDLIRYAYRLLAEDHPQTLRQLHYAVFSRDEIDYQNDKASYQKLSRATTLARRTYRERELLFPGKDVSSCGSCSIPPAWMVDETRQGETPNVWTNATEYIEAVKESYHRDMWQDQLHHVEVWAEKATILGSLRPVAKEWGITLRVCHGFGSTGMEQDIGSFFEDIRKPITVFYLGDHDPSGHCIEEDLHQRVETASGRKFYMERLAIHPADIEKFKLPPQQIKASDSRAAGFRREFGSNAATVELDALPAAELRRRVEEAITGLIDFDTWDRQVQVQRVEFSSIARVGDMFKNLRQAGPEALA